MRIAIATAGRFHVLDLARELRKLGHEVAFYSYVPKYRASRYGLQPECHISLLPFVFPLLSLRLLPGFRRAQWLTNWIHQILDILVRCKLRPCDVFIGMSGIYVQSAVAARTKFGARVFVERGSRHILSQLEILKHGGTSGLPDKTAVARELASYELAETVVVPSHHVCESFAERGYSRDRIFVNPYGVDVDVFRPVPRQTYSESTAIFVGTWSRQKGVDILVAAIRKCSPIKLLHVGALGDAEFPTTDPQFCHVDPVDQHQLPAYYQRATVFVLASRQDGLALVLLQALACGIPVVCTTRTGGADLTEFIDHPEAVKVVRSDDEEALACGIAEAVSKAPTLLGRDLLGSRGRSMLTWEAYARRYDTEITRRQGRLN
jgi:glycosyltransferase involved in cell wall biosynthesis